MKKIILFLFIIHIFSFSIFAADEVETLLGEPKKTTQKKIDFKPSEGVVVGLKGQVFIKYDGDKIWKQLLKGDKIREKSTVITMEESEITIKLTNDANATILPKSRAYMTSLKVNPKVDTITETEIKLMVGKVYSNIKKSLENGSRYEVKTGSATAGVRGTQFTVWVDKLGNSGVSVFKGIVAFGNNADGKIFLIREKEKMTIDNKGENKPVEENKDVPPEEVKEDDEKNKEQSTEENDKKDIIDEKVKEIEIDEEWLRENFKEIIENSEKIEMSDREQERVIEKIVEIIQEQQKPASLKVNVK